MICKLLTKIIKIKKNIKRKINFYKWVNKSWVDGICRNAENSLTVIVLVV